MAEKKAKREEETFGKAYLLPYILIIVSIIFFIFTPILLIKLQSSIWIPILLIAIVIFLVSYSMLRE